jgi:probable phosphoglycerate mutase
VAKQQPAGRLSACRSTDAGDGPARTRILLIRHANAVCNARDTFAGHVGCKGLTEIGRAQCGAIADRVQKLCEGEHPVVVSSVMRRAVETARVVHAQLGGTGAVPALCGLCERHPGSVDGIANSELRALHARGEVPADVERPEAVMLRVRRELRRIARAYQGRTLVVVTHSGVVAASFWVFGAVPGRLPFRVQPDNGSVTEWSNEPGEPGVWWLRRYNDTAAPC